MEVDWTETEERRTEVDQAAQTTADNEQQLWRNTIVYKLEF